MKKILILVSFIIWNLGLHAQDNDKNWVYVRDFDESGNEVGASKNFFDNCAKATQTQIKNKSAGDQVLASQVLYDFQGRFVGSTLSAPINSTAFGYKNNFVTVGGNTFSYLNFDGDPSSSSTQFSKLNAPDAVDSNTSGTLGWYFSSYNNLEPGVASTGYPYSRVDYFRDGTGMVKRSAGIDALRMGNQHEAMSAPFPVGGELNIPFGYLSVRNKFFSATTAGVMPTNMTGYALQSISKDEQGLQTLSVTDLGGKPLMTGRADPIAGWLTVQNTINLNNVASQYSFSVSKNGATYVQGDPSDPIYIARIHQQIREFSIKSVYTVTVTCVSGGLAPWTGIGNDYVAPSPPSNGIYAFIVTSASPFYITASNNFGLLYDQSQARIAEPNKASSGYFWLTGISPVSFTGNVAIYNMSTESQVTGFTSGSSLPAGYYKVMVLSGDASLTYTNKYTDVKYNYYNQLGQLIAAITPNGTRKLFEHFSDYSGTGPIPYSTTYTYDVQGRMTSTTSTDAGKSEFAYSQDGKLRFSQNTAQQMASPERFSYTNYDRFDRPVESGEYVVSGGSPLTFSYVKGTTAAAIAIQESTAVDGGLTGGNKQMQVYTYYDSPATNMPVGAPAQDAGYLKGTVSYTANANSTTWYNYDDKGRVTRMIKLLPGLPYKTVDYTYNDQGNVSVIDYQKNTTAGDHFIHYYSYDAAGRLVNVQTSRGESATPVMAQQAVYSYYMHGPLKRVELGSQLQGIDYTYTAEGWLKAINSPIVDATKDPGQDGSTAHPGFATDVFGMQLEYFTGDYTRSGSSITSINTGRDYFNGTVSGLSWQSKKSSGATPYFSSPAMFLYTYDPIYQMTKSELVTPNFINGSFATTGKYTEQVTSSSDSYDGNGNIMGIKRIRGTANTIAAADDLSNYGYIPGTNKLGSVGSATVPSSYASYTYDEIGQLKSQLKSGITNYLRYEVSGKVTGIYNSDNVTPLETFTYDESGNRTTVTIGTGTPTRYIYDASGNVLAIYNGSTIKEIPVYGSDRLGTYTVTGATTGSYAYELRDNVGSVRAVIRGTKVSGQADVTSYFDYYPFGSNIQFSASSGYDRYGYQGEYAEKDAVTGFNNFDLRLYDSQIGRWLSTDPEGQYSSPYQGMGNNPITGSDPTGGVNDIDYNTTTKKTTIKTTLDPIDRYSINGVLTGYATKGLGGLDYYQNKLSDFGIKDVFVPWGDYKAGILGGTVTITDRAVVNLTNNIGTPWLNIAMGEIGVRETRKTGVSNPRILEYFMATENHSKTDATPWCAAFQNWVLKQSHIKGTNSALAASFKTWGTKLDRPAVGALMVLPNNHHVTEIAGITSLGQYVCLGGNQGDAVQYSTYSKKVIELSTIVYPNGYVPNYILPVLNVTTTKSKKTN